MIRYVLFFIIIYISPNRAEAAFGLGPCCGGAVCGIIPCDVSCAGNAFIQLGLDVSTKSADQTQVALDTNVAISTCSQTYSSYLDTMSSHYDDEYNIYIEAFDKFSKLLEINIVKLQSTLKTNKDNTVNIWIHGFTAYIENKRDFIVQQVMGEKSFPKSLGVFVDANRERILGNEVTEPALTYQNRTKMLAEYMINSNQVRENIKSSDRESEYISLTSKEKIPEAYNQINNMFLLGMYKSEKITNLVNILSNHSELNQIQKGQLPSILGLYKSETSTSSNDLTQQLTESLLHTSLGYDSLSSENEFATTRNVQLLKLMNTSSFNQLLRINEAKTTFQEK